MKGSDMILTLISHLPGEPGMTLIQISPLPEERDMILTLINHLPEKEDVTPISHNPESMT